MNLKTSVEPAKTPFALSPVEGWTGFWQAHPMGERVVGRSCFDKLSTNGLPHTSTEVFRLKEVMQTGRHIRLLQNGANQSLCIPREFESPRGEAIPPKEGNRLTVDPMQRHSLQALLGSWQPADEDFSAVEDKPPEAVIL